VKQNRAELLAGTWERVGNVPELMKAIGLNLWVETAE
jgi:hypothetical protein